VSESTHPARVVRFGVFEVDLCTAELRKQGVRVRLSGQPFQVLETLLLRPGELVTREELKQKLWPSESFGDFEHGLNAAVNRVREALGDSSDNPRLVETLPRRGYRFIAHVEQAESETKKPLPEPASVPQDGHVSSGAESVSRMLQAPGRWLLIAALLMFLAIAVGAFLFVRLKGRQAHEGSSGVQQSLRVVPLTTLPGVEDRPSFSPDASQVVFAWDGGSSQTPDAFDLYVKAIGSEKVDRLTHEGAASIVPAWSPDGSTIAFARQGGNKPGIFSVPARGGAERKLADASFDYAGVMSLSWSADGRQLLYYTTDGLRILTTDNDEVRPVDTPGCEASAPAFSPDGKWISFACEANDGSFIDLISLKDRSIKHLVKGFGAAWSVDSQRIIFLPLHLGISEIGINGGNPVDLAFAQGGYNPAIARQGNRLAYVKGGDIPVNAMGQIWRSDTRTGVTRSTFAPASVQQNAPDISPDGKRIAFESERSGSHEVWVANLDGSDAIQLSKFNAGETGTPHWSPDGRWIVFDSRVTGRASLYLVDPATAIPKQISTSGLPASVPRWSADGKQIYFTSESTDPAKRGLIYRVTAEGGIPEQVTQTRGYNAQQSKDGRFLYFFAGPSTNAEIHVLDLTTGREQPLKGMPRIAYPTDWVLRPKGIFFVEYGPKPSIDFFDFSSQGITRKIPLDRQPIMWGGLSLSPDETWLAYSQVHEFRSDLVLVEGFR
jgi:Tol biopolymer transport system component/DNA-binding winged helix-turn-helix (wHTH) protein